MAESYLTWVLGNHVGPLEEQQVFLTAEPSLQTPVLLSFNCQLDTVWSQLTGKPQLSNCLDQIGLWVRL